MKITYCTIRLLASYEENAGKYECEVKYEDNKNEVKLVLDPEISTAMLAFLGPVITKSCHKAALQLEANIQQAVDEAKKLPELCV